MQNLKDLVDLEKVLMLSGNTFEGVKTGFEQLDSVTGGLADGEVIVLVGRPAMGKTAFACAFVDEVGVIQKEIAFQLSCPVFVLSQLNRKAERRTDHRPMLCDLRDSGVIEDMADEVMLLYRDDYYFWDSEDKGKAELKAFKCSRASVSTLIINYDMSKGQFKN